MKEAKSSILKYGNKVYIYVPFVVSSDSTFPFKKGQKVKVKITDDKLLIEKA
jgi:hypothetical protein